MIFCGGSIISVLLLYSRLSGGEKLVYEYYSNNLGERSNSELMFQF